MDKVKVYVGRYARARNGQVIDDTKGVEFEAEKLALLRRPDLDGTRGTDYTLYRTASDRLVVHIYQWSKWQGEPDEYILREVSESDLGPDGEFWLIGEEAGMGRPLTLDEALEECEF